MEESRRYDIGRYRELIYNYLNYGSTELGDLVLTGDDLLDLAEGVENIRESYKVLEVENKEIKELSQELIKDIERIFKGKKGHFVEELRMFLDHAKEQLEE